MGVKARPFIRLPMVVSIRGFSVQRSSSRDELNRTRCRARGTLQLVSWVGREPEGEGSGSGCGVVAPLLTLTIARSSTGCDWAGRRRGEEFGLDCSL